MAPFMGIYRKVKHKDTTMQRVHQDCPQKIVTVEGKSDPLKFKKEGASYVIEKAEVYKKGEIVKIHLKPEKEHFDRQEMLWRPFQNYHILEMPQPDGEGFDYFVADNEIKLLTESEADCLE